jgi:hypothetical protein
MGMPRSDRGPGLRGRRSECEVLVRQAEADSGLRPDLSTSHEREEILGQTGVGASQLTATSTVSNKRCYPSA